MLAVLKRLIKIFNIIPTYEDKLVSIKFKTNYIRFIYHLKGGSMKKCSIHYIGGDYISFQMSISVTQ